MSVLQPAAVLGGWRMAVFLLWEGTGLEGSNKLDPLLPQCEVSC